jgi:hypothetical protein
MRTTIEMAREAAGDDWGLFQEYMPEIHRLAELVRADERAQRTWVGLTESEKSAALYDKDGMTLDYEDYAEALEAKLKEKNT